MQAIVEVVLQSLRLTALSKIRAPEIKLLRPRASTGPCIAAMRRGGATVVAVGIQIKLQRHAAGSAGGFADQPQAWDLGAHLIAIFADRVARDDRPSTEIVERADVACTQIQRLPHMRVVRAMCCRVLD